jgi:hypothetical protein
MRTHALDVPIDRHQRHAEAEQQNHRRGLADDAVDLRQPGERLGRRQVAQELERVVTALLADVAQRRLDARRLLVGQTAGADDVGQLADVGEFDRGPVGRCFTDACSTQPGRVTTAARSADRPSIGRGGGGQRRHSR